MARMRQMELRHLHYFAAIAEASSFTRAAERLRVSQPALSRQIRDLEDEIGQPLFERLNNGARLTPTGERFLRGARKLLAASDALLAEARGCSARQTPPLRISHFGALAAQHIGPFLRKLTTRMPTLKVHVEEEVPGAAVRRVRTGTLDAAFTGLPDADRVRGLQVRVVWVAGQEILVPANHRFAKRRRLKLAELRDESWGMWDEKICPGFTRPAVEACEKSGYKPQIHVRVDSLSSILMQVAEGSVIGYAPPFARQLAHPGVVFIPLDPPDAMPIAVALIWRTGSPHHEALCWLAETMRPVLIPQLAGAPA